MFTCLNAFVDVCVPLLQNNMCLRKIPMIFLQPSKYSESSQSHAIRYVSKDINIIPCTCSKKHCYNNFQVVVVVVVVVVDKVDA